MITQMTPRSLQRLEAAMKERPGRGPWCPLIAVGLLLLGWLAIYFFIFLPRGTVG